MPIYSREVVVTVLPFTRQREGEDIVIGRIETGVFLAVPPEAVELLDQLAQGKSIGQVSDLYQQEHGETLDLDDFLQSLENKGIIVSEKQPANLPTAIPLRAKVRYHFTNFPQSLAQKLFSRAVLWASFLLFLLAVGLVIYDRSLVSGPRSLYFPDHRTLSWSVLIVFGYCAVFVHEFGHLIAARALGINSRMGIGHRLWWLVVETDLTGLWSVPKQQRYLPFLAGAIIDVVSESLTIGLLFAHTRHWIVLPVLVERLVRAMTFAYVMRLVWQCLLFVRTDFYYVIASLFSCRSLLRDTEDFLRNLLARVLPWLRHVDQSGIPGRELRVIRAYSVLWILGRIAALSMLSLITIPLFIYYSRNLAEAVRTGYSANPGNFLDAMMFTFYFLMPVTLGITLWIRSLVRGERS